MTPAELIKAARLKTRLSQNDFAFRSEINKASLQNWEQGRKVPSSTELIKCLNFVNPDILKNVEKMLK